MFAQNFIFQLFGVDDRSVQHVGHSLAARDRRVVAEEIDVPQDGKPAELAAIDGKLADVEQGLEKQFLEQLSILELLERQLPQVQ